MQSRALATLLVLVFAEGASAATCADGSSVGSNGCCAATNDCPPCLVRVTSSGESATCTCSGCAGESVTIDPTCAYDSCAAGRSGISVMGCELCSGPDGTCMPDAAALSACGNVMPEIMPGLSISSSGLISASAGNPSSGLNPCDVCCPTGTCGTACTCNACGACCPAGTCDSPADASKPECEACNTCINQGTPCKTCDTCCPVGMCDSPADASKPACEACNACYNQGIPCPADWTEDSAEGGVSCPTGCVATRRARARRLLFSSLPLECGPGCEPM